jgi:Xaa-Pro aminopeptidase
MAAKAELVRYIAAFSLLKPRPRGIKTVMFQRYDDVGGPAHGAERVRLLRKTLNDLGLAGFLIPRADEYQNEYVPPEAERLLWLTGFSGSWGLAALLADKAALFVDGRYTLQAARQTDPAVFEIVWVVETKPNDWLAANLGEGDRLGYDPRLHTIAEVKVLTKALAKVGALLVPVEENPVTGLRGALPPREPSPVILQPISMAGREASAKIADIQGILGEARQDAAVITALDSIAWLFNIRGGDLPHTPFVLSHAIVPAQGRAELFISGHKLSNEVRATLAESAEIDELSAFAGALAKLGQGKARVRLDAGRTSQWIADRLSSAGATISEGEDPCILPKAKKNAAEIAGSRAAHHRDGIAMCRFLAWLDREAPRGKLDEIKASEVLEEFRRQSPELKEISFDTISGSGPNGAIVHYRVNQATNRKLKPNSLYLVDSGGQYQDGTTDITRTVAIGEPTADMRRHFTLVLRGHIAIAMARFPKGTRGCDLDAFARRALWEAGLDYDHGTGHGIGSYLSVHEGPQGLSKRAAAELEPGMILSNEPGYYRTGKYGIRIENLLLVKEPEKIAGGERPMMTFETLTLAPIDRRLIDASLLTRGELDWLNAYHKWVRDELAGKLSAEDRVWLRNACAPLSPPKRGRAKLARASATAPKPRRMVSSRNTKRGRP